MDASCIPEQDKILALDLVLKGFFLFFFFVLESSAFLGVCSKRIFKSCNSHVAGNPYIQVL